MICDTGEIRVEELRGTGKHSVMSAVCFAKVRARKIFLNVRAFDDDSVVRRTSSQASQVVATISSYFTSLLSEY